MAFWFSAKVLKYVFLEISAQGYYTTFGHYYITCFFLQYMTGIDHVRPVYAKEEGIVQIIELYVFQIGQ